MIRELLENYLSNKRDIQELKRKLEIIELEEMPSCIQVLSDMPKAHNTTSQTERTALSLIDKKKVIDKMILSRRQEIQKVDEIIDKQPDEKFLLLLHKRFREGKVCRIIQEEMNTYYSEINSVEVALSRILDKLELEEQDLQERIRKDLV